MKVEVAQYPVINRSVDRYSFDTTSRSESNCESNCESKSNSKSKSSPQSEFGSGPASLSLPLYQVGSKWVGRLSGEEGRAINYSIASASACTHK